MTYRNTQDALAHRLALVEKRLEELQQYTASADKAQQAIPQLNAERDRLRVLLQKHQLPQLEDIKIASPCNARWEDMLGDDRVRLCGECCKKVYNLSGMLREEAQAFLAAHTGEVCVRLFRREDGTVLTADCPVEQQGKVRRRVSLLLLGASAVATLTTGYVVHYLQQSTEACERLPQPPPQPAEHPATPRAHGARPPRVMMGAVRSIAPSSDYHRRTVDPSHPTDID